MFGKVHKELLGWFIHNPKGDKGDIKHSKHAEKSPEVPERPHRHQPMRSTSEKTYSHRHTDTKHENKCVYVSTKNLHSKNHLNPQSSAVCEGNQYGTEKNLVYDYPNVDRITDVFRNATQKRPLPREPSSPVAKSATIPAKSHTGSLTHESSSNTITENPTVVPRDKDGGNYVSLSMKEAQHLFHDNLTADDFYKYTVLETTHCFRHCGLETLADKCYEHRLDGSFFKNFDLDELKKDPFNLTSFNVLKVQKMIFDGWRPKN